MQTLNSVHSRGMSATIAGIGALAMAVILLLSFAPFFSSAAGTTVTVQTSASTYASNTAGGVQIPISGTVSPAPSTTGYSVTLSISNTNGLSYVVSAPISATSGTFSYTLVTGTASGNWVNGTYTVTAIFQATLDGPTYTGSTTFVYGTPSATTTTSATSGGPTTTTTIITSVTTVNSVTTINSATTLTSVTTVSSVTTLISSMVTTMTSGSSSTALYLAIVGIIIAVIAGAIAAMALRKH